MNGGAFEIISPQKKKERRVMDKKEIKARKKAYKKALRKARRP